MREHIKHQRFHLHPIGDHGMLSKASSYRVSIAPLWLEEWMWLNPIFFKSPLIRSYRVFKIRMTPKPREMPAMQSVKVCTPSSIRANATPTITSTHRTRNHHFFTMHMGMPKTVEAVMLCPLGKEYPGAPSSAADTKVKDGSAVKGRCTWRVPFNNREMPELRNPHIIYR